jgi:hypothetical protein
MVRLIPADEINKELRNARGWLNNDDPFFDTINSIIDERSKHVRLIFKKNALMDKNWLEQE